MSKEVPVQQVAAWYGDILAIFKQETTKLKHMDLYATVVACFQNLTYLAENYL